MKGRFCTILLALLMATMSMTSTTIAEDSGRQMDDVDCSGYTFEDLFEYDNAVFMFQILDDWASSDLYANSWVNETRASVVRDNLDGLFEGFPGGNNSWISTDERDAVREIGAKCIADMYTRIGIREGIPHRGGVDWNDVEFVEEGIGLEEVDLIPTGHPEQRSCAGRYALASTDCEEVPTSATNNLEISMFVKDDQTHNTRFNKLPNSGESDFTVAMNVTNITSATMMFTFPYVEGMRMANWTILDDGVEDLSSGSIEEIFLPDGSVRVSVDISYDKADWPMIRNIFFDMTTSPPETNDVPQWTGNEPVDDTIIPMLKDGSEVAAISAEVMADWATDNDAWGLDCQFAEAGWSSRMNSAGELLVTPGSSESGTATCAIVDPYGETNNLTHTWRFGQPATFSATPGEYSDVVTINSEPTLLVQNLAVSLAATQLSGNGPTSDINLGSSASSDTVSLSGLSPGAFMIHIMASSPGMLDWEVTIDLSLEKTNTPAVISVDNNLDNSQATWSSDKFSFSLSGTVIDPDGGEVTMSATMCGETTTSFSQTGINWDVSLSIAKCVADGMTQYDVILSAEDSVGAITNYEVSVPDPYAAVDNTPVNVENTNEESGLPAPGMITSILVILGAAIILRKD